MTEFPSVGVCCRVADLLWTILSGTWISVHDATKNLKLFYLYGNREHSLLLAVSVSLFYESVLDRFTFSISDYQQPEKKKTSIVFLLDCFWSDWRKEETACTAYQQTRTNKLC